MARQDVDFLVGGHINENAPGDDRRNGGCITLLRGPQSLPQSSSFETVVPMKIQPGRDVCQAVDLRRHIVGNE